MANKDYWILIAIIVVLVILFSYKVGVMTEKIAWCESEILTIKEDYYAPFQKE